MPDRIRIEWAYKPVDYFEDRLVANLEGIDIEIYNGSVIVEFDAKTFDNDPSIRDRLEQYTQSLFKGARLQSHAEFEISGGAVYRLHPGGRTDVTIFAETAGALAMAGSLDIKVTDSTGKVIKDTRQERFNEKRHFALAVASQRGKDATLDSMLASYDAAVRDPKNELVHLYEIRDALAARFGGETKARTALRISSQKWSRLGRLANEEPLWQGRHRGKSVSQLRDATPDELSDARSIAREMVISYINYLGRQ